MIKHELGLSCQHLRPQHLTCYFINSSGLFSVLISVVFTSGIHLVLRYSGNSNCLKQKITNLSMKTQAAMKN
jgi:hypothetical protein